MKFREDLGIITCTCVLEGGKPVLFVSHAGGDWQMYCHDKNHNFEDPKVTQKELCVVHAAHLLARDPTLHAVADLPVDMGAERADVGAEWVRFPDADDEATGHA